MSDQTDDDEAGAEEVTPRPSGAGLPQPGDIVAERYRIEHELGHGGMAVVYAATQLSGGNNRQVALKWLFEGRSHRQERRRRFLREARAAGMVQHRNVVRVYDAGEHKDGVYLVMELVEGESLTKHMQRGKLEPRDAIDLLMPAMRGMAAAHKQGIIHRDLKPDNLYVCKARGDTGKLELKVLDFGLSKLIGPAADSLHTIPGTLVGTPQYMAPEQADGRLGAISERSDVYTLAVILYEAIAGQRPFESETLAGQLMKIAHDDPTPLRDVRPEVPEDLADTIMWALARDPLQRPANVEDFAIELERFGSVGFADNGRMSEAKGSMRPRKISDRSPAPTSDRAPAPASPAASVAPPPAHAAPAASEPSGSRAPWLIAGALALLVIAAFVLLRGRAPSPQASGDAAPSGAAEPAPAPPAAAAPDPAQAAPSAVAEPASAPAADPDAGAPQPSETPPPMDATGKRPRSTTRSASPAPAAPVPAPTAAPVEVPPPQEAAPDKPRSKRSPGVADPWAESAD